MNYLIGIWVVLKDDMVGIRFKVSFDGRLDGGSYVLFVCLFVILGFKFYTRIFTSSKYDKYLNI